MGKSKAPPAPRPREVLQEELREVQRLTGEKSYFRAVLDAEIAALHQKALALNQEASRLPPPTPKGT